MTDQSLHAAVPARVCVIIVNWNAGAWLVRCVESLQVQTLQPVQVLLVDNASTDDSLAQLLAKCSAWAPLRILQAGRNVGFAAGNNLALAECDSACDYVALLNPDAFAAPDWLERLVEAAHQHPEACGDPGGDRLPRGVPAERNGPPQRLQAAGCDGILVGEGLVRAEDIAAKTREFSGLQKSVDKSA